MLKLTTSNKFWKNEEEAVELALQWAKERTVSGSDPKTTALSAKVLDKIVGQTITKEGLGAEKAMEFLKSSIMPLVLPMTP